MRKLLIVLSILFGVVVAGCASPGMGTMEERSQDTYLGATS